MVLTNEFLIKKEERPGPLNTLTIIDLRKNCFSMQERTIFILKKLYSRGHLFNITIDNERSAQ